MCFSDNKLTLSVSLLQFNLTFPSMCSQISQLHAECGVISSCSSDLECLRQHWKGAGVTIVTTTYSHTLTHTHTYRHTPISVCGVTCIWKCCALYTLWMKHLLVFTFGQPSGSNSRHRHLGDCPAPSALPLPNPCANKKLRQPTNGPQDTCAATVPMPESAASQSETETESESESAPGNIWILNMNFDTWLSAEAAAAEAAASLTFRYSPFAACHFAQFAASSNCVQTSRPVWRQSGAIGTEEFARGGKNKFTLVQRKFLGHFKAVKVAKRKFTT